MLKDKNNKRETIHEFLHRFLLAAVALTIPFGGHIVPPFIALLGLNWILEGRFREKFAAIKNNKMFWLFCSFYFLHIIGLLYTSNMDAGLFDLEEKCSLLVFPLLIGASLNYKLTANKFLNPVLAFIAGCLATAVFNISSAIFTHYQTGEWHLFYTDISFFMHPSYYAMYLTLGIAFLSFGVMSGKLNSVQSAIAMSLELLFFFMIILLQSKAGIIITGLVFLGLTTIYFFKTKSIIGALATALMLYGMYWGVNKYIVTSTNSRIFNAEYNITEAKVNAKTDETSQVRILIWKAELELLPDYFLFGTGTGDAKDVLLKKYKEKGMEGALEHKLNAHDQFLQSFLALGLPGLILLLSAFVFPFIISLKEKRYLYLFFLVICGLNFLPEAMLEAQAGVVFYAFFNSLFMFRKKEMEYFNF